MQAVKDSKKSALDSREFSMIIDRHSPGIELEAPPDSLWKVIPHVIPARVCKINSCHVVVNLMGHILFRSTWLLFLTTSLEGPFHKSQWK